MKPKPEDVPNPNHMRRFAEDGYVVIPDVVPDTLISSALAEVDALMAATPPDPASEFGYQFFWLNEPDQQPALIATLEKSGVMEIMLRLVVPNTLAPIEQIQVSVTPTGWDHIPGKGHIDGLTPPLADGSPGSFSFLAGIFLSDQTEDNRGNLHAWRGSHLENVRYFAPDKSMNEVAIDVYLDENPAGKREAIKGKPGDLLLAHYLLSHNMGGNTGPDCRKMLYFRVCTSAHRSQWREMIDDPLHDFPAVKAAL